MLINVFGHDCHYTISCCSADLESLYIGLGLRTGSILFCVWWSLFCLYERPGHSSVLLFSGFHYVTPVGISLFKCSRLCIFELMAIGYSLVNTLLLFKLSSTRFCNHKVIVGFAFNFAQIGNSWVHHLIPTYLYIRDDFIWHFCRLQNFTLPFNKYAWITTHNAYAIQGETSLLGSTIISSKNQEDSITSQLNVKLCTLFLNVSMLFGFANEYVKISGRFHLPDDLH